MLHVPELVMYPGHLDTPISYLDTTRRSIKNNFELVCIPFCHLIAVFGTHIAPSSAVQRTVHGVDLTKIYTYRYGLCEDKNCADNMHLVNLYRLTSTCSMINNFSAHTYLV